MIFVTSKALCEHGGVFAQPDFVWRIRCSRHREILHRLIGLQVRHKAEVFDHSTTFTKG
jgi:hypothetical protein